MRPFRSPTTHAVENPTTEIINRKNYYRIMGYVVLHLDKSPDNEVPMTAHIARTKMPPNAIPELTYLNEELVEFPEGVADRTEAINHRLEHVGLTRKIGTNQVRVIRVMLTGTQEDMKRIAQEGRLKAWCADNLAWLRKTFGTENVVSAVLHMDEATPHIHIDFIPFTTGSNRGLETRVSLKQALLNMGFKGEGRSDNELNRWILSEKKVLAQIMERHGIEWEQKGTHEQHLSVLDYKKQERAKEVAELDREIEGKQLEVKGLKATAEKIKEATDSLDSIEHQLDNNPELQLPEPQGLMSAKSYKKKFVDPLIQRLKNLVRSAVAKSYLGWENYHRINNLNGRLYSENKSLKHENSRLKELNNQLREQNKAYRLLEKVFGKRKLNEIIEQARGYKKSKQRDAR